MPFIVEDGTGVAGATSYLSVEDADLFHEDGLYSDDWLEVTLTLPRKERALMAASRMLDDLWRWRGVSATTTQGLDWPLLATDGSAYFPYDIKRATAEVALWLIQNPPGSGGAPATTQVVESAKLGQMEVTFAVPNDPEPVAAEVFPVSVARYLNQYGSMGSGGHVMRLRR